MKTTVTIILLCLFARLTAQNYRNDILAVNKMLLSQKNYSLQLHYDLFVDGNMQAAFQQRDVKIVRQASNLYVKQNAEMEVIETKAYQILIDHGNQLFSAVEKDSAQTDSYTMRSEAGKLIDVYVDTMTSVFKKIKIVQNDANVIKYECTLKPNDEVSVIWVEIDKKLKLYRSVTTQYIEKRKIRELDNKPHAITLTVRYSGYSGEPAIAPTLFNEKNYLVLKDHKIIGPTKKYTSYRYLNNPH